MVKVNKRFQFRSIPLQNIPFVVLVGQMLLNNPGFVKLIEGEIAVLHNVGAFANLANVAFELGESVVEIAGFQHLDPFNILTAQLDYFLKLSGV